MPFYVGDYLADTGHLNAAENGAYLMLIMHYWRTGSLPADDELRRRVSRMTHREWQRSRMTVLGFFSADGKHKRIDEELSRVNHKSSVLRDNALKSHDARRAKAKQEHLQNDCIPEPESKKTPSESLERPSVSCPKPPKRSVRTRATYPGDFEAFWRAYPTDAGMSKQEAFKAWKPMPAEDRHGALHALPAFKAHCATLRDYRMLHACRYLSQRRFEGHLEVAQKVSAQVFVRMGSPQWRAWEHWIDRTRGKRAPVNKEGTGWWFKSEWPPGEERKTG